MTDLEPGDRVVWAGEEWSARDSLGTVVSVGGGTVLVDRDGTDTEYAAPADGFETIGCDGCEGTGFRAERREGTLYRFPCFECAEHLKDGRYWPHAAEYRLLTRD